MNVTTKTGDDQTTFLLKRRPKDDLRVEVLGLTDELIAHFLLLRLEIPSMRAELQHIIQHLDDILAYMAVEGWGFNPSYITYLEERNLERRSYYEELDHFVKAQTIAAAKCNLIRTKVRTLERRFTTLSKVESVDSSVLIYLNRLSDYLFILMLALNQE